MSETSLPEPSAPPPMPSFLAWAGPILSLWALAGAWFASLYSLTGERPSLLEPETLFEPNESPSDRVLSTLQDSLFAMPVISAVYLTAFFFGLHVQHKKSVIGKVSSTAFSFILSRLLDIPIITVYFVGSTIIYFVTLSPFFSLAREDESVLFVFLVLPVSVGVFFSAGITWIVHRLVFDQNPGNSEDWFKAHLLGYAGGVGLLVAIVTGVAWGPDPRVMYVAMAGLLLLPLPHLLLCYQVTRKHCEAGRIPAENMRHTKGFFIDAGLFAVAGFIAVVMMNGWLPARTFILFLVTAV